VKYFSVETDKFLACPCCGLFNLDEDAQVMFDSGREYSGVPWHVNSCCRCKRHNLKVGGSKTSSHLADEKPSCAMDVQAKTDFYKYRIIMGAIKAGFKRIFVYKNFIHLDTDKNKEQEIIKIMER